MSEFITPEHKIIALILEASGEPTDADKVCCLGNIPDVALAVRQLRETVIQHCASEAIPAENTQTVSECLTQPFSDKILPPQNSGESEADRPEIEPVHAATALQGNDKQEAHSEMVDDTASEGVQDTLKKFLMQPGSYRPRLPSRRNQKTWIKPVRLFLTTFQLTPQSVLYGPGSTSESGE